jgi:hypothetical protein
MIPSTRGILREPSLDPYFEFADPSSVPRYVVCWSACSLASAFAPLVPWLVARASSPASQLHGRVMTFRVRTSSAMAPRLPDANHPRYAILRDTIGPNELRHRALYLCRGRKNSVDEVNVHAPLSSYASADEEIAGRRQRSGPGAGV